MFEYFEALADPDVPFVRYALIAGLLAGVAFGIVGTYVVTRRITYIAAAISHSVLGGIGAALYAQRVYGWTWCQPMYGAVAAALTAALLIGVVSLHARQREDTVIGAVWAVGMAAGLLFLAKTPGYVDPMSYLFGDISLISRRDLWLVAGLDALVVLVAVGLHNKLLAVCFDQEFTELRGVRVKLLYLMLLCLTALTVVLLVRVVGIVLVIALLTLPAAAAGHLSRRLGQMMAVASFLAMGFVAGGLGLSYTYNLPAGPTIILLAGGVYLATVAGGLLPGRRVR